MSFNSNTTGVTCGAGTANLSGASEYRPGFQWGSCCSIFSFLCSYCPFVNLFLLAMHCLCFFDLRRLIVSLVSSNFSCCQYCFTDLIFFY
jgi:hypothetical protein